ncbi:DnaB-like helicase C-terminal domain-containing protein, partial [Actinomadura sp. RB99]|uniref:DnaB-like helicase C-terminal domain-containing protein n=1 Tax=Actinomadura sp. RB99 TaxID=2691577 RepID=UPI0024104F98
ALSSTELAAAVLAEIGDGDLAAGAHQVIMAAVADLFGRGVPVTPDAVLALLTERGELGRTGGAEYLFGLFSGAALPAQIGYYAERVRHRSWKGRLAQFATFVGQLAGRRERPADEDRELLAERMDQLAGGRDGTANVAQAADVVDAVIEEIERGADQDVVPLGVADLDEVLSVKPGQLIVVGARPGIGKTTLGLDIARHIGIRRGEPVYFLSLEMARTELMRRMLAAEGR